MPTLSLSKIGPGQAATVTTANAQTSPSTDAASLQHEPTAPAASLGSSILNSAPSALAAAERIAAPLKHPITVAESVSAGPPCWG